MAKILLFTVYDHVGLGIRILASHLEAQGHEVVLGFMKKHRIVSVDEPNPQNTTYEFFSDGKLFNSCFDVFPWSEREISLLLDKIAEVDPDIVGLGSRSVLDDQNVALLARIRQRFPAKTLVAGGFGPSLAPAKYLSVCDFVLLGEAEDSMQSLVANLGDRSRLETIPGLAFLDRGEVRINSPRIDDLSIDRHPFPKYGENIFFIDRNRLQNTDLAKDERVYYAMFGRGCVAKCTYCCSSQWSAMYHRWGAKFPNRRNRSLDNMVEEIKRAKDMGFVGVCFVDTYLISSPKTLMELFRRIKDETGLPFDGHLHMQQVVDHPELLATARECGLGTVTVGIQHGCERVSRGIYGRTITNEVILRASHLFLKHGMNINYSLIEGNPLATEQDFLDGLELIKRLPFNPDTCSFTLHKLKNLPKTPLTLRLEGEGFTEESKQDWHYKSLLTNARLLTDDDVFADIMASELYRKRPRFLAELIPMFLLEQYSRAGFIVYNEENLPRVYERTLMRYNDKDVIVWWNDEYWNRYRHLFANANVIALLNSDPAVHGRMVDGQPIQAPEFLHGKEGIPVFICSPHKREIVPRIRTKHGANHLIIKRARPRARRTEPDG